MDNRGRYHRSPPIHVDPSKRLSQGNFVPHWYDASGDANAAPVPFLPSSSPSYTSSQAALPMPDLSTFNFSDEGEHPMESDDLFAMERVDLPFASGSYDRTESIGEFIAYCRRALGQFQESSQSKWGHSKHTHRNSVSAAEDVNSGDDVDTVAQALSFLSNLRTKHM